MGGGWQGQFRSLFLDSQQSNQNRNYAILGHKDEDNVEQNSEYRTKKTKQRLHKLISKEYQGKGKKQSFISNNRITREKREEKSRKGREGEGQEEGAQTANKN